MKKSLQSKLTAALFAAAISTSGGTLSPQLANAFGSDTDITTVPETTYGPPVWMMTTDETEEEIEPIRPDGEAPVYSDETTGTTLLTTAELMLAGTSMVSQISSTTTTCTTVGFEGTAPIPTTTEPEELVTPGEAPLYHEPGDPDYNGSIDAETYDVNMDGDINREDVKALLRLLTGKPEDEEEKPSTDDSDLMTATTTLGTSTCPLYGPPPAY